MIRYINTKEGAFFSINDFVDEFINKGYLDKKEGLNALWDKKNLLSKNLNECYNSEHKLYVSYNHEFLIVGFSDFFMHWTMFEIFVDDLNISDNGEYLKLKLITIIYSFGDDMLSSEKKLFFLNNFTELDISEKTKPNFFRLEYYDGKHGYPWHYDDGSHKQYTAGWKTIDCPVSLEICNAFTALMDIKYKHLFISGPRPSHNKILSEYKEFEKICINNKH